MEPSLFPLRSLGAALACSLIAASNPNGLAQVAQAYTDPVGFITLDIAGTGGVLPSQLSFKGLGLTRPIEYQGSAENVQTNTLTDNEATWTDNQFNGAAGACFLEITSGPGAGTIYDISATSGASKTITLAQNLATGVANGATFKIRKHWTIGTVFGPNNEGGLQAGPASTADQVLIYNGSSYETFFYSDGGLPGIGWRKVGAGSADQANAMIYPDEGLIVQRRQSAVAKVVLMGAVKMLQTSSPVLQGLNFLGNVYAAPMTLSSSGLYTGNPSTGVAAGTASTADEVLIYNGSSYDTYFYSNGGLPGVGWRKVGGAAADQAGTQLAVGSSIIVKRKGSTAFNWVAPQHPANL